MKIKIILAIVLILLLSGCSEENHIEDSEAEATYKLSAKITTTFEDSVTTFAKTTKKTTVIKKETTTSKIVYKFPVDINAVTTEQLMHIEGVGKVTAQKIMDYRNAVGVIRNLDMLLEIDGIGQAALDKLKGHLYVSDEDYVPATPITTQAPNTTTTTSETATTTIESSDTVSTTTTSTTTSRTTTTTVAPQMKKVNINTASAQELSEGLLIDIELAEDIVELRTNIQYFVNDLELLYVDGFSEKMLVERSPYIEL